MGNIGEKMRLDASGNVLVGKTASGVANTGAELQSTGFTSITRDGGQPLQLNRKTSDGDIAVFKKDGTTVGSIGSYSGTTYIQGNSVSSGFLFGNNDIYPWDSGALSDGVINLGTSTRRFKDLYLSGGVYLGGTGSANYLDDYEEGTWTVTITGSATAGSHSSVYSSAWYVKTGALVTVGFVFEGFSGTGSGNMLISGLPFNPQYEGVSALQWNSGLDLPTGTNTALMRAVSNDTDMEVRCNNDGTGGYVNMPYPTSPSFVRGVISYRTAS